MPRIARSSLAKVDAAQIWQYIARDNEQAADNLIDQFEERFKMLAQHPNAGESHQQQMRPPLP